MGARRLLVVDDEPRFRDFVGRVAVKLGFDVEHAADGRAFKSLYQAFGPDVAVMDVVMPGIDGNDPLKSGRFGHWSDRISNCGATPNPARCRLRPFRDNIGHERVSGFRPDREGAPWSAGSPPYWPPMWSATRA